MNTTNKKFLHYDLKNSLIRDFNEILKREEDFWKLKSRVQWLNDRDANTKLFHMSMVNRKHRTRILGLYDFVGNWTFDPTIINDTILHHYQNIHTLELIQSSLAVPTPCNNPISIENKDTLDFLRKKLEMPSSLFPIPKNPWTRWIAPSILPKILERYGGNSCLHLHENLQ